MIVSKSIRHILVCSVVAMLFSACNLLRYVPEGETLLNKVTIKSDVSEAPSDQLQAYLRQTPNSRFLGIGRAKLGFYSSQDINSNKWKDRWLRKIGEEPVIYDSLLTLTSQEQLTKQLNNKGYLDATVEVLTTEKKRQTNVTFVVTGHEPYKIRSYTIDIPSDSIMAALRPRRGQNAPKAGDLLDVDALAAERESVARYLRRRGYFYFQKEALAFEADSSAHEIGLKLTVHNTYLNNDSLFAMACTKQTISSVTIYDIATAADDAETLNRADLDTTRREGYTVIQHKKSNFRAKMLTQKVLIQPHTLYNERRVEQTYSVLNALPAIKYVDISFKEAGGDSLACVIVIAPAKKHSFSVDIEGTNSAGDLGVGVGITYQNKNAFKGGEILKIGAKGSYEAMGKIGEIRNTYEAGGDVSLSVPFLLFPFATSDFRRRIGGTTEFAIGYNLQQRPEYQRHIANLGMKYAWNIRRTRFTFDLIDINYIYLPWITDAFREQYLKPSSSIRYSYEDHFIMRLGFGIQHSNKRTNSTTQSFYTLRGNISTAGNLLYGISSAIHQQKNEYGQYEIFNIAYAQYVKGDFDFTYNHYINKNIRLVCHAGIGVAYPYGKASVIPYEERYFSGGANSVRGWAVRTLGPGRYANKGYIDYMNQSGDIRLDLNLEARFKLFWKIYGALFVDAGNIWTIKEYEEQPGGFFQFSEFYKEIACSYGIGLRADFDYFVIRLDMGIKLYEPSGTTSTERWRTDLTWKNDFALHFAIGYPF